MSFLVTDWCIVSRGRWDDLEVGRLWWLARVFEWRVDEMSFFEDRILWLNRRLMDGFRFGRPRNNKVCIAGNNCGTLCWL